MIQEFYRNTGLLNEEGDLHTALRFISTLDEELTNQNMEMSDFVSGIVRSCCKSKVPAAVSHEDGPIHQALPPRSDIVRTVTLMWSDLWIKVLANYFGLIISVFQILHYLAFSSTTARTIILEKESIFRDIVRIIPHVKQDGRGVFWCFRLLLTLVWDTDSRDAAHRANVYKVLPVTALSLKENRHVMLASLLAIEALVTGYTSIYCQSVTFHG